VSRTLAIVLLGVSGFLSIFLIASVWAYFDLQSTYDSNCEGITGVFVKAGEEGQMGCEALQEQVRVLGILSGGFLVTIFLGLIIGFSLLATSPPPAGFFPNQPGQTAYANVSMKEFLELKKQAQQSTQQTNLQNQQHATSHRERPPLQK